LASPLHRAFNGGVTAAVEDPTDPNSWQGGDEQWEYAPLRIAADVSRSAATAQLALHAEFGGWELARVQRYEDGSRRVMLRRKRRFSALPLPQLPI
jgi:hypothetical protein